MAFDNQILLDEREAGMHMMTSKYDGVSTDMSVQRGIAMYCGCTSFNTG